MYLSVGFYVASVVSTFLAILFLTALFKRRISNTIINLFKGSILGETLDFIIVGDEEKKDSISLLGYIGIYTLAYLVYLLLSFFVIALVYLLLFVGYPILILCIPAYFRAKQFFNKTSK
jgi:hypothetical protein